MYCEQANDFEEVLDLLENGEYEQQVVYAYLEDPFGVSVFDEQETESVLALFERWRQHKYNLRVVLTSRTQIYNRAASYYEHRIFADDDHRFVFKLSSDLSSPKERLYDLNSLREIFERIAWLKGAAWLSNYQGYLKGNAAERKEWAQVVTIDRAPGSLFSILTVFPDLLTCDGRNKEDILRLVEHASKADDLRLAFGSEIRASLTAQPPDISKALYMLLPAVTPVNEITINRCFSNQELDSLRGYRDFLEERPSSRAYEVKSYRFFNDALADAARIVVLEEGRDLLREIVKVLPKRKSVPEKVLADVLSTFYAVGGDVGGKARGCEKLLRSSGLRTWVDIVVSFFKTWEQSGGVYETLVKSLAHQLVRAGMSETSSFAGLLDQIAILNYETLYQSKRMRTSASSGRIDFLRYVADILREFLHSNYDMDSEIGSPHLKTSILLHGILAHCEYIVVENTVRGGGAGLMLQDASLLREMKEILEVIRFEKNDWLNSTIIWLDALLMKIGELHYHLSTNPTGDPLSRAGSFTKRAAALERIRIEVVGELRKFLLESFLDIWKAAKSKAKHKGDNSYLKGGMAFSLAWHNRWAFTAERSSRVSEPDLGDWLVNEEIYPNFTEDWWQDEKFLEGINFNVTYHANYFRAKAEEWGRESAIYVWSRERPRLGADSLYESGLKAEIVEESVEDIHSQFYSSYFDRLFLDPRKLESPIESLTSAVFVLGIRAARQPELSRKFIEQVAGSVYWPEWLGVLFWEGISYLFMYSFRDSERVVKKGLQSVSDSKREHLARIIGAALKSIKEKPGLAAREMKSVFQAGDIAELESMAQRQTDVGK